MRRSRPIVISTFTCRECQHEIPLPRRKDRKRERGHVKDIWCPRCQQVTKHTEDYP